MNRPLLPITIVLATFAASAASGIPYLRVETARILPAADGLDPAGASWRTWSAENAAATLSSSGDANAVGTIRPGAAWIEAGIAGDPADCRRITACELALADASAPGGLAGALAVLASNSCTQFVQLADTQLVRLPAPDVTSIGGCPVVRVEPLRALGAALTARDGLEFIAVERGASDASAFVEIGRFPASALAHELRDDAAPPGAWRYAIRPVFIGGVAGLHASPAGAPVPIDGTTCTEPSGDSARSPVRVVRAGDAVTVTWDGDAGEFDVLAADLARLGAPDAFVATSACRVTGSSTTLDVGPATGLVVARRCGGGESSLGRDSFGWERRGPAAPCP